MGLRFTKMHGIGNDYIYFDCFKEKIDNPEQVAIRLSDRHFGVGGDGIVLIMPSEKADFRMRMFNADGSEGKMCGNATRCIGKYVYERGLTDKTKITLETLSGIKRLVLEVDDGKVKSVGVDMGKAELRAPLIPVISTTPRVVGELRSVAGTEAVITCVSMGNPHCVVFTDGVDSMDIEQIGPKFENDIIFPDRVNTEFVQQIGPKEFKMRVWERGSGETWACGTGACAVCVAAVENGLAPADENVTIHLRGGDLVVNYHSDGTVIMRGPATFVFDGELTEED